MSGDSMRCSSSMEITLGGKHDNMEHETDPTEECSLPGVSGEPTMRPRVGNQYQALVPDFIEGNESSQPNAKKVNESITVVLPIPLMWAANKARDAERLSGHADPYAEENQVFLNRENCSMISKQAEDDVDNQVKGSEIRLKVDMMKQDATSREGTEKQLDKQEKNLYPLPGTPDEPWTDFEREAFLLALYIFGKDLYLVKKFVETKKMEDVISFYYGPFYKCKEYERWAKCLRSRSRKSIHGQRIFTGGRQQELLSRLNRHLAEETSNKLVETSKTFKEDGLSFEEYVFTLKELVGTKLLIEVVAIGEGKRDLTGISTEPRKLNNSLSVRKQLQQDKGLSSLSCKEITEQLLSSRLSKNKSNELFWEAVWPRLLAGGWHSEQPKDLGVSTSKHHLVFLMPGIAKFKRKKHVKGRHYFDSVSDVLNKVASDPQLLELEDEKDKDIVQEENHFDGQDLGLPNGKHKPNGYKKSSNSNPQKYEMEFMIVDTSKHRGSKVRWLESLPVQATDISTSSSAYSGTESDSSSEKSDVEGEKTCTNISAKMTDGMRSVKKQEVDSMSIKKMSSKKHRPWEKLKSGPSKYLSPLKPHQVNAAGREDLSEVTEKKKDKRLILCFRNPYKLKESKQPPNSTRIVVNDSSHLSLPYFSHELTEENGYMVCESSNEIEKPPKHCLPHAVLDLNLPQAPEDVATNHGVISRPVHSSSMMENTSLALKHKDTCGSSSKSASCELTQRTQPVSRANVENQQPPEVPRQQQRQPQIQHEQDATNISGRRQSTRNRPLTTKALEAFESYLFETTKKRKANTDSTISKPPRPRRRVNSKSNSTSDSGISCTDMTSTRIEEESATGNSGNAPTWLLPSPPQVNLQLQLQ